MCSDSTKLYPQTILSLISSVGRSPQTSSLGRHQQPAQHVVASLLCASKSANSVEVISPHILDGQYGHPARDRSPRSAVTLSVRHLVSSPLDYVKRAARGNLTSHTTGVVECDSIPQRSDYSTSLLNTVFFQFQVTSISVDRRVQLCTA